MTKRGNNEGSIYQRKDGRWAGAVTLGYAGGKLNRKTIYGTTRKDVQAKPALLIADQQKGLPIVGDRLTVGAFLSEWLSEWVKPSVKPKTFSSYSDTVRLHLAPTLGRVALSKLSPQQVQALMNERLGVGLSPRSVGYIRSVLGIALNRAVKIGLLQRNIVDLIDAPRVQRFEMTPLTFEQARALLTEAQSHRFGAVVSVALAVGLRKGEALALRWQDIDLEAPSLTVSGTLQRQAGLVRDETKNNSSRRLVQLPPFAVKALREHRVRQMQERLAAGDRWRETGYVFTTQLGTPVDPRNLSRHFDRMLKKAGLPDMRFHDLRHSCATLLFAQGVPAKLIQATLGHSALRVTMDIYTHVMPQMRGEAADAMEAALGS